MEPTNIVTVITDAFTGLQTGIMDAITAVAPIAVVVLSAFLAFRYGKKIFALLSK